MRVVCWVIALCLIGCREEGKFQNFSQEEVTSQASNATGTLPTKPIQRGGPKGSDVSIPSTPVTSVVTDSGQSMGVVQETLKKDRLGQASVDKNPEPTVNPDPTTPTTPTTTSTPACSMGPSTLPTGGFKDTAGTFYEKDIEAAARLAIVAGYPGGGLFKPTAPVSREEVTIMALKSLQCLPGITITIPDAASIPNDTMIFTDVALNHWSAPSIFTAKKMGLVAGYPAMGLFMPSSAVTNAEVFAQVIQAVRYARIQNKMDPDSPKFATTAPFTDTKNHWSHAALTKLFGFCEVAQPLHKKGTEMRPNLPSQRDYATATLLRMRQCLQTELTNASASG